MFYLLLSRFQFSYSFHECLKSSGPEESLRTAAWKFEFEIGRFQNSINVFELLKFDRLVLKIAVTTIEFKESIALSSFLIDS